MNTGIDYKVLNVRSTPVVDETNANKITSADQGNTITALYKVIGGGLWAAVELDNGIKGWISDAQILPDKPVVTTFEKEVVAYIDEVRYPLTPLEDWGQAGKGHYNGKPLKVNSEQLLFNWQERIFSQKSLEYEKVVFFYSSSSESEYLLQNLTEQLDLGSIKLNQIGAEMRFPTLFGSVRGDIM